MTDKNKLTNFSIIQDLCLWSGLQSIPAAYVSNSAIK